MPSRSRRAHLCLLQGFPCLWLQGGRWEGQEWQGGSCPPRPHCSAGAGIGGPAMPAQPVLQESPLYDCRCKRGMKKELQCLQIYWSIHLGLTEGEEFYEASPYEPVTSRLSDIFRLASIFSGNKSHINHCLDAAKACNLNDNCKRLRSGYISTCSKEISATEHCSRRKCHKALRQFFDRVPSEYTYRLLFCSCKDQACAERRRQTIVPSCSYEDKEKPNCLDLRNTCRTDHLCRSRLADFHTNCQASFQSLTSCPGDNYQACLGSYAGLIGDPLIPLPSPRLRAGFDMTPNYVDASTTSITISPWCSCKGSGNMEEECEKFLRDFTENPCLRNAIQAFGNGTDVNLSPKNPSPPVTLPPKTEKSPALPDDINDSNTMYDTSIITTCTSVQVGPKPRRCCKLGALVWTLGGFINLERGCSPWAAKSPAGNIQNGLDAVLVPGCLAGPGRPW
uniref:GDNF family receptor alpha-2 n=1 Tax=Buteo japonicus TaxID=224669 RepID=A0A8B9ZBM5_9AVES